MLNFSKEKRNLINKLTQISDLMREVKEEIGMDENFYSDIQEKIRRGLEKIEHEQFHISFFGSFSDGKSTILSALTKNLGIKIAPEPTTDKINTYNKDDYLIVDTPGLFAKDYEIHDERTKKYISEADVIIYVVDAVNPIKESHFSVLNWLMNDLKKIDSTIIVINKMDTVVSDLEDEENYTNTCNIKKEEVKEILRTQLSIPDFNRIVCIAADPYGRGLKAWFEREEEYLKLSRFENLNILLENFIKNAQERLKSLSALSIIEDLMEQSDEHFKSQLEEIDLKLKSLDDMLNEWSNKLEQLGMSIRDVSQNIKQELLNLRGDILISIKNTNDRQELADVMLIKLGKDGYILENSVKDIFESNMSFLNEKQKEVINLTIEILEYYDGVQIDLTHISKSLKFGFSIISKLDVRKIRDAIIYVRDLLKIPVKFKSWQALRIAGWFKKIGPILPIIDSVIQVVSEIKFANKKKEIEQKIEDFFSELITFANFENLKNLTIYDDIANKYNEFYNHFEELESFNNKLNSYKVKISEILK